MSRNPAASLNLGRSEPVCGRGIGYHHFHTAIDDRSRLAYAEALPDETPPQPRSCVVPPPTSTPTASTAYNGS
jgi:hypothetical protein